MACRVKPDEFLYIEKMTAIKGGVTALEFSEQFYVSLASARAWLSKWKALGYLTYSRGVPEQVVVTGKRGRRPHTDGRYSIDESCKWWGDLAYSVNKWTFDADE